MPSGRVFLLLDNQLSPFRRSQADLDRRGASCSRRTMAGRLGQKRLQNAGFFDDAVENSLKASMGANYQSGSPSEYGCSFDPPALWVWGRQAGQAFEGSFSAASKPIFAS